MSQKINLAGMSVLVVDDHEDCRELLRAQLLPFGVSVGLATDGDEALRMMAKERPDLVLCDLNMPRMNGFELVRCMRRDAGLTGVRVLALTCLSSQEAFMRTWEAGFDGHLVKPIDSEILAAQLMRAFGCRPNDLASSSGARPGLAGLRDHSSRPW